MPSSIELTDFVADCSSWRLPDAYGSPSLPDAKATEASIEDDVAVPHDGDAVDRRLGVPDLREHRVETLAVHPLRRGRCGEPGRGRPIARLMRRCSEHAARLVGRAGIEAVERGKQHRLRDARELRASGDERGQMGVGSI
jgi:hypothetical protein